MATTSDVRVLAKKAAFETAYNEAMSGGGSNQGAANKVYDQVMNKGKQIVTEQARQEDAALRQATVEISKQWNRQRQADLRARQQAPTVQEKTAAQKRDEAQQLYDAYIQSDEYKQNLNAAAQAQTDSWMMAALGGNVEPMQPKGDRKEQELKALVDHYTAQAQQEENQATLDAALRELEGWSEEDRKALEAYGVQRDFEALNPMADPITGGSRQVSGTVAAPLIAKYGEATVNRMAEALKWKYSAEATEKATAAGREEAGDSLFDGLWADAKSVGAKGLGNLTGLMGYMQELGQRTGQFSTLNPNNIGNLPNAYGGAVQGQKAENIAAGGELLDKGAAYLYQGGMSVADNALRMAMGGGATGGSILAATGSFSQAVSEASAQGATPGEAVLNATITAGIEAASEKIPLDNLMDAAKTGGHGVKEILKNVLIQGGIEATTEEISLIGSALAEAAILKEKAGYQQRVNELIAGGMTPEGAARQADNELLKEAADTAIVSFLSGGLSEAGASVAGNLTHRATDPGVNAAEMQQTEESVAENAAPVKVEPEAAVTPEEAAEQLGRESPREEKTEKTEGELGIDRAYEATVGAEQQKNAAPEETTVDAKNAVAEPSEEESNPPASAGPTSPPDTAVPQQKEEVNVNIDESRAQGVDTQEASAEGGQDTGDGLGAVGAAASRFRHEVRTSKVYDNTYKNANDPDVFASGIEAQQNNERISQYDVITEEESLHEAELRSATGQDRYVEYKYLMKKDGWTGADNDTAMKLLTAFRKEGKTDRFNELARKQRKLSTDAGQFIQSFAKYSRSDATVAVLDAVETLDKLEMDQVDKKRWKQPKKGTVGQADDYSDRAAGDMAALKQENTPRSKRRQNKEDFQKWKDSVTKSMLEIANDIENVEEGDAASMRDIVRQLAQYRRTTAWMGNSSNLTKNADRILTKMDFDTAKTMAKSQLAMIPNDFRKRSTGEVVKAVRIQNMLSALTTTSRNLAGNATTGLMDAVSDSTGGQLMDAILSKFTGKRTVGTDVKYAGEYLRAARDAADMASLCVELDIPMDSEAAYSTGKTRTFRANGSVVERFMSSYEKYLKYSLEVSDKFFEGGTKGAVSKSLADLGAKTGLTEEQIQGLAQKAGERRTFKEGRKLAQLNTGFKKGLNLLGKGDFGAGDILIPFAGVPGDVIQTGIDYSGAGLIEGLFEAHKVIKAAQNGKTEFVYEVDGKKVKVPIEQAQRKAASDFGRGATGALLIAVFTAASVAGLIKVHNDEDRDKRALDQSQGLSGAQLNLDGLRRGLSGESTEWLPDDELVSIDFLEPFNSQMYIGAMMAEAEDWKDVASAPFRGILSAVLDMPMVQTASDIAELATSLTEVSEDGNMDAVEDAWGQLLGNTMTGFIPSWMRQAAQTIDPIYRDTSGANAMEKAKNQFLAAVPFASKTLPAKYDGLGNEQRRYDNVWEGFLDNFVTPWTTTTLKGMPVNDKLRELSDSTGDDSIYPEYQAPRAIKVDGEEVLIDGKEMTEKYQKTYGDNINAMYAALMSEQGFNELPEDQQIDAFKKAKEYATKLAKAAVSDYDEDLPEGDTSDMVKDIMFKTRKSGFNEALLDLADAWDEEEDPAEAIAELDRVYEEFKANVPADKRGWFAEEAGGGIKDYITARKCGVDAAQFADLYRQYKGIDQRSDLSQTQKAEEWASVLQHEKEAGRLKAATVANLKDEMGFYVTFQQEATKYNQMVDDGLTADNADMITHLLDGITGTGKVDKETGEKKILNRDNWRAIAKSGLKDEQLDIAMKAYMDDYDPNAESPDKTELRYDYARQELGLTAEEYVKVITVQQEGGEKAEKIADWRELGFTAQEANMFYRLFAATGRTKIDVEAWAEELYG